jgi:hypothetical protein
MQTNYLTRFVLMCYRYLDLYYYIQHYFTFKFPKSITIAECRSTIKKYPQRNVIPFITLNVRPYGKPDVSDEISGSHGGEYEDD